MKPHRLLTRHDIADMLDVTIRQLRQLLRNPTFPQPVHGRAPDEGTVTLAK